MLPTDFKFPPVLAKIGQHLPHQPISIALCAALALAQKQGALKADFSFMAGRSLAIVISDLGLRCALRHQGGTFKPIASSTPCDVQFTANSAIYLALLRRNEDPDTLFFQRKLRIEGDTELGLALKNILDAQESPAWLARLLA